MNNLISVIVPVYKVEIYLRKCVDSILDQTYSNLEVILVDDGSPDNCGIICDEYAKKDSRVVVIHKENGGLSDARNAGMAIAKGEMVIFVDSDDWLPLDAIEKLFVLLINSGADVAVGDHVRSDEKGLLLQKESYLRDGIFDSVEFMEYVLRNGCAAWAQLYRREVHINQEFPVGEINEDEAIVLKVLSNCRKIAVTAECVYYYRCRAESITTNAFSRKKMIWKKHCLDNWKFVKYNYPELEEVAILRYRGSLVWLLTEIAMSDDKNSYSNEIKELMEELYYNKKQFLALPVESKKEYIRLHSLYIGGFELYSRALRILRRMKK